MNDISRRPGRYICRISAYIDKLLDTFAARYGITSKQHHVLQFIAGQHRVLYQKDIEEEYNVRPATATQMLQAMENEGLIRRVPDEKDKRKKRIEICEDYRATCDEMVQCIAQMEERMVEGIAPEQMAVCLAVLEQIAENIQHMRDG